MPSLVAQRCLNHLDREAVARCVSCTQYFCRECITEHDERILCRTCLQAGTAAPRNAQTRFVRGLMLPGLAAFAGLLIAWMCFFAIGRALLSIPSDFHPETLWAGTWQIGGGDE